MTTGKEDSMRIDEAQDAPSSFAMEELPCAEDSEREAELPTEGDAPVEPMPEPREVEEAHAEESDPAVEPPTDGEAPLDSALVSEGIEATLPREAAAEALSAAPVEAKGIVGALVRFFSKRAVRIAAASLLAPVLVSAGILIGVQLQEAGKDPSVDPNAEKYPYVGSVIPQEGEIAIPGYADMTFSANTQDVRVALINPEENDCYFVFSFLLGESAEEIYRSGLIPPGMAVTEQTLSRSLPAGEYLLVIRVQTYSTEDKRAMNSLDMEVRLTVN